jgi:hypothetical protein
VEGDHQGDRVAEGEDEVSTRFASKIYADFQNLDDANRLRLNCVGTLQDLERQGVRLTDGLIVTFYTDDADDRGQPDEMRAEGVVHYDAVQSCWVAEVDWNNIWHASDEAAPVLGIEGG